MQKPAVTIMVKAARAAGNVLLRHMNRLDALNVVEKERMDYASEVDGLAEAEIVKELKRAMPDCAILGEETGSAGRGRQIRQGAAAVLTDPAQARADAVEQVFQFGVHCCILRSSQVRSKGGGGHGDHHRHGREPEAE